MAFVILLLEAGGALLVLSAVKNESPAALIQAWIGARKAAASPPTGGGGGGSPPKTQ